MKIRKAFQGTVPDNKILDTYSTSQTDTYSCNFVNNLNTYSTTEQAVGKWLNGKTLYRQVLTKTISSSSSATIGTISDVDYLIIGGDSFCRNDQGTTIWQYPLVYYKNSTDWSRCYTALNTSTHTVSIYWEGSSTSHVIYAIIYYTKASE